ncbi:MAG: flippase [Gammaproteobacteria bacterium]
MSATAKRILENSILRVGGYAVGALIYFAIIVLIARYLGAERFGYFSFILALVGMFQLLVDMGVRNVLIRDIAVDKTRFAEKLGVARTLLWALSFVTMALIVLLANLLPLSQEVRQSIYLAGLAVIVTFYALGYSAVLRAFEEMEWDILGFVLHKCLFIGLIGMVINTDLGLQGVFGAMLAANSGLYLYCWGMVRLLHGPAKRCLDLRPGWVLLKESLPLGIAEILRRSTWHVDKLLLAALSSPVAVGVFSAGFKFLEAINPFANNLTLPLFPAFSRFAQASPLRVLSAFEQSLKFLFVIAIPLAITFFVFADRVVVFFFGTEYAETNIVLKVLAPAVILVFPNSAYGYVFTALRLQRNYTVCVALSLLVKVLLELFLIPWCGYVGAAIGTVVAEGVLFCVGLLMLRRLGDGVPRLGLVWRPCVAGLVMGFLCWRVRDQAFTSALLGAGLGLAVYAGLLLLLKTFTRQELALLVDAVRVRFRSSTQ